MQSTSSSSFILLLVLFATQLITSLKECTDYEECRALEPISDDGVSCSGSDSCREISIDSTDYVNCTGWYSCAQTNIKAKGNVYCHGGQSCAGNSGGSIRARILSCGGSASCDDYFPRCLDANNFCQLLQESMAKKLINI